MSNAVFPVMPGLTWDITREPIWSTTIKTAVAQREFRSANMSYPRYRFKMVYSVLRQTPALPEMAQLAGFFNARQGSFDSFLFTDPDDNAVAAQQIGLGDGATGAFQLLRAFGGYLEPVFDVNGTPQVFLTDWRGTVLQSTSARTNKILYSEQLDNAASWTAASGTLSANAFTAPDGNATGDRLTCLNATAFTNDSQGITLAAGTYTFSVYVRNNGVSFVQLLFGGSFSTDYANFDLTTGLVSAGTYTAATMTNAGGGWFRISITSVLGAATSALFIACISTNNAARAPNFVGDGVKALYMWGAQIELGALATSYIPTTTVAVTKTDISVSATGVVSFTTAPAAAVPVTWTGSYYRRMRFEKDTLAFNQFMQRLWDLKTCELLSVKP